MAIPGIGQSGVPVKPVQLKGSDIDAQIKAADVFRRTHRGPRILTSNIALVTRLCMMLDCYCSKFRTEHFRFVDVREGNNVDLTLAEIIKAIDDGKPFDLLFIEPDKDADELTRRALELARVRNSRIAVIRFVDTVTDNHADDERAQAIRALGYNAMTGPELADPDDVIENALGEEGVEALSIPQ